MEKEKKLLLIINTILDKNLFYANRDSLVHKSIAEFNDLCENFSSENLLAFLNKQDNKESILDEDKVKLLKQMYAFKGNNYDVETFMDLGLREKELLTDLRKIKAEDNTLPFSLFPSVIIDKKFFNNIDIADHFQVRKILQPLSKFIYEIKNKDIFISDLNIKFIYQERNQGSGHYSKKVIVVKCEKINSSTLQHEYFHAIDAELATKLNVKSSESLRKNILFSENSIESDKLKRFNSFIASMDENNSNLQETKDNLSLYFRKHFSPQFNDLKLSEIKELSLIEELELVAGTTYVDYTKRDSLVKELQQYINYTLGNEDKPKRTLFSIFCDVKDLSSSRPYYATNCEKLARIYQAQYHKEENKKMFPLGSELKLTITLNNIVDTEISHVIKLKNENDFENRELITANIFKIRKLAEHYDIQSNLTSKP